MYSTGVDERSITRGIWKVRLREWETIKRNNIDNSYIDALCDGWINLCEAKLQLLLDTTKRSGKVGS